MKIVFNKLILTALVLPAIILLLNGCKNQSSENKNTEDQIPSQKSSSQQNFGEIKDSTAGESPAGDHASAAERGEEHPNAPIKLPVESVRARDVPKQVVIPGVVSALPDHSVKVTPSIAGKLVAVLVAPGQNVRRGQVIAKLEDRHIRDQLEQCKATIQTAQANLLQANDNLNFAKDNLQRQTKLYTAEVSAQKDVISAQNQVKTTEAQLQAAKAQVRAAEASRDQILVELGFTQIHSPISGVVANRYLNLGDTVDLNTAIVQVVGLETVLINASLPADSPERAKVGEHAIVRTVAHPDVKFDAVVQSISPVVDQQSNTIRIQLRCQNRSNELNEGQNVNVAITQRIDRSAILIPRTALVPDPDHPDRQMVYKVDDNKAKRVPVKVGSTIGSEVEVLDGLKVGDRIVSNKCYGLPDDTPIEAESK